MQAGPDGTEVRVKEEITGMTIYVNINAGRDGDGTKERPFRSINDAAKIAKPGDEVTSIR